MSSANKVQHGGAHYRKSGDTLQHWDWAIQCELGYLESAATKYLSRWWLKHSDLHKQLEDLNKAVHYLEKLSECAEAGIATPTQTRPSNPARRNTVADLTLQFLKDNYLAGMDRELEAATIWAVAAWSVMGNRSSLDEALNGSRALRDAVAAQVAAPNSGEAGPGYTNQDR